MVTLLYWGSALVLLHFGVDSTHGEVNVEWMEATLQTHFSQTRHHASNPAYKRQSKEFIRAEFESYGLETHSHVFTTSLSSVSGTNVIGILKGEYFKTSKDRVVGVAAHYDTARNTSGVDGNGAAVVALLQAAKYISKASYENTVIFVAFDFLEWEPGSNDNDVACTTLGCGSERFLNEWTQTYWRNTPKVSGVIVMDYIMNVNQTPASQLIPKDFDKLFPDVIQHINSDGGKGDFIAVIGRTYESEVIDIFSKAYTALGQPEFDVEKISISFLGQTVTNNDFNTYADLMRSDHYSFWKNGLPAIFLTDTANYRGYLRQCYHEQCDNMSQVTPKMLQFTAKVTQAVIGTVNKLAVRNSSGTSGGFTRSPWFLVTVYLFMTRLICSF